MDSDFKKVLPDENTFLSTSPISSRTRRRQTLCVTKKTPTTKKSTGNSPATTSKKRKATKRKSTDIAPTVPVAGLKKKRPLTTPKEAKKAKSKQTRSARSVSKPTNLSPIEDIQVSDISSDGNKKLSIRKPRNKQASIETDSTPAFKTPAAKLAVKLSPLDTIDTYSTPLGRRSLTKHLDTTQTVDTPPSGGIGFLADSPFSTATSSPSPASGISFNSFHRSPDGSTGNSPPTSGNTSRLNDYAAAAAASWKCRIL